MIDCNQPLNTLATAVHQGNIDAGWWSNPKTGERIERNVGELLCLVHSEVTEAWDGFIGDLMDDKLPHRKMVEVEIADAQIRLLDIAGAFAVNLDFEPQSSVFDTGTTRERPLVQSASCQLLFDTSTAMNNIHRDIDRAMEGARKKKKDSDGVLVFNKEVATTFYHLEQLGRYLRLDVRSAMSEKIIFNSQREDHKIENRVLDGGKSF